MNRTRVERASSIDRNRPDWRGWIALAWVVFWGLAYAVMVVEARGPQVVAWIRTFARIASPHRAG